MLSKDSKENDKKNFVKQKYKEYAGVEHGISLVDQALFHDRCPPGFTIKNKIKLISKV